MDGWTDVSFMLCYAIKVHKIADSATLRWLSGVGVLFVVVLCEYQLLAELVRSVYA
jgi:hypothetical protein